MAVVIGCLLRREALLQHPPAEKNQGDHAGAGDQRQDEHYHERPARRLRDKVHCDSHLSRPR